MGTRHSNLDFYTASPQLAAAGINLNGQSLAAPSATQVIPAIDTHVGGSYSFAVGRIGTLRCEAGYHAAVYFNAINQFSLTERETSLPPQVFEGTASTFLRTSMESQSNFFVHGPYLKVALQF